MSTQPRVLVTDAEERSVLAACRGLAAAGYRVSAVSGDRLAVGHWSRRSHERIVMAGPHEAPGAYVDRLSDMLRRRPIDVVVPGTEASLVPISEQRSLIEPHARLGLPAHGVVLRALDKRVLQQSAAAAGLSPPPSIACATAGDARAAARELGFPVVVKPARSFVDGGGRMRHRRAEIAEGPAAVGGAVAAVGLPLTVQQYIANPTIVSCAAVRIAGRVAGLTVVRYARTFPADVGSAALAVTIPAPRTLAERVEELLARIGWSGIFELELLELGGGRFGAIDFNPRPFGWMALAIGAGANLPALWCDFVLGRTGSSPCAARTGVRYRWEEGDLRNVLAEVRRGRVTTAAAILRPHRRVVHALFRIDDPAPLAARVLAVARTVARRKPTRRFAAGKNAATSRNGVPSP